MHLNEHFFIGIPGPSLDPATKKLLKQIQPGGIILFGRNVQSASQVAQLTLNLRKLLGPKLLICLDHEGGRVNRLKDIVGVVPSALQLGFLGREDLARKHGQLTGRLLRELGVNLNLAPVLDLLLRPKTDNSVPDRCWSRNPKKVTLLAGSFLEGMQREGVIGCGKHFLGYGAADKDPHLLLPRVNRTRQQVLKEDLFPYSHLLPPHDSKGFNPKNLRLIMLSHAHLRAFHGNQLMPASISPKITGELLRQKLKFEGVSITDDLEMGAITRTMPISDAVIKCLSIGVDFILICHTKEAIKQGFGAVQKALDQGLFPLQTLDESRQRIKNLQDHLKATPCFSERRFKAIVKNIHSFTKKIFSLLPESLRAIDPRWGAIGEKY